MFYSEDFPRWPEVEEPLVIEFYVGVTHCEPGNAAGCRDLTNRGHDDWPEITCWPNTKAHALTTGREFKELQVAMIPAELTSEEQKMCEILGLTELELGIFLRDWTPLSGTGLAKHQKRNADIRPRNLEEMRWALRTERIKEVRDV